ncbi:DUF5522 domain-containing protein [Fulvivirgaceae bacterium BMA12]|uniref:DUF5522 domain-containing protein n=1 Tax=Agaribacillus aureus TaxID=3051825 RepID=A0ABT8L379_9BACT|nr:DUF5522 domain-containing protein [Fulvivirgaceae bacterium BMA12]
MNSEQLNNQRICPGCKTTFTCQPAGDVTCWCEELPAVSAGNEGDKCLCPHCLAKRIQEKFKAAPEKAATYLTKGVTKKTINTTTDFKEGLDYYINEQGNWVFTTFYHLKKGYCCQNECKHCPYGYKKK